MNDNLPAIVPSLARAFEPERTALKTVLSNELSAPQIVREARRALDRAGASFADEVTDPQLQKSGLWLIEMVKAGAGILDQASHADIIWKEMGQKPARKWAGRGLFYGAAGLFAAAGFVQGSGLVIIAAATLAGLRFFDPKDWGHILQKLPFSKRTPAIEDQSGRRLEAKAQIRTDPHGFITQLVESLKTADHILLRLAEPHTETHWGENKRLMTLVQNLLEAQEAKDGDFALTVIGQELTSVLTGEGIELVNYSKATRSMFDVLPAIGEAKTRMAAPALMRDGQILRRGTIWQADK